jgi:NAD(P)-dependent dehydrogenase (short-subunit alcohol dehydrogenase family)
VPVELNGRSAIVTGASRGLGFEIARALGRHGARVLLNALDPARLEAAVVALRAEGLDVAGEPGDVACTDTAGRVVMSALDRFGSIQILVNNAGIYGPMGRTEEVDWNDWVRTLSVNLLGSVSMCRAVLPHLRANSYGKILQLSGGGATAPLENLTAYSASKAAVVRFAETLARETRDAGIDVNAIAPGALNTDMLNEVIEAGPEAVGADYYARALGQREDGGASIEGACRLVLFLASGASDGITGRLISAVWDAWETLPGKKEALATSDIFTLRRVVPEDRGLRWTSMQ